MGRSILILAIVALWITVGIVSCAHDVAASQRVSIQPPGRREVLPIPEPGTWALLAGGLVVVIWLARRR